MKRYTGLLSLVAATVLITGCADNPDNIDVSNTENYSISGDVIGCVYENLGGDEGNPLVGAEVSVGTSTTTTNSDGCFSLAVTYTTTTVDSLQVIGQALITYPGFEDSIDTDPNSLEFSTIGVINGVMADFGDIALERDDTAPQDRGIMGVTYDNNMLAEGIDGVSKPFELLLSEAVELSSTIDADTIVKVEDVNATELNTTITATITFSDKTNILSIQTSEAIAAGNKVTFYIPQESITDDASNMIESGTDFTDITVMGDSMRDYFNFSYLVFRESDADAQAVSFVEQLNDDTIVDYDEDLTYDSVMSTLESSNATFKNVVKHDENALNWELISQFNNDANNRVANLANAYTGGAVTIDPDVIRVEFTPTNANYYILKVYDENNNSVTFNSLSDFVNADVTNVANGDTSVKVRVDTSLTDNIEVALKLNAQATQEYQLKITPYTRDGLAGTSILKTIKDNVAPSTSLQYSYDNADDGAEVVVSGGVQPITSEIYGGSGEISNSTFEQAEDNTTYTMGYPILNMTYHLLADKDATLNNGDTDLANDYNASEYAQWKDLNGTARSFGIGMTEPVVDVTFVSASSDVTVTPETNSTSLDSTNTLVGSEDVVIVSVVDIFAMVNDENGSKITLNVSDMAGNSADVSVVLNDKVEPFIVSADLNVSKTITFSESLADINTTITIDGIVVNVYDVNYTTNIITLDDNESVLGALRPYRIDYRNIEDTNGNNGVANPRTFRVD